MLFVQTGDCGSTTTHQASKTFITYSFAQIWGKHSQAVIRSKVASKTLILQGF